MGYSQHAGVVIVCDGSEAADRRLERVLWNDPATGVPRDSFFSAPADEGTRIPVPRTQVGGCGHFNAP